MPRTCLLDSQFDLIIRAPERLHGHWSACGDIKKRESEQTVGRVYGSGRTGADAQQEVVREAERWLLRESQGRPRIGAMN